MSFFRDGDEVVQVHVDDRSGAIVEQWSGDQVAWRMARGYEGAFGRKLNAPYVWIPLCLLFLAPFFDLRPFRLLHLDLLVMLAFGVSHFFFNRGEIGLGPARLPGAALPPGSHAGRRVPPARARGRSCPTCRWWRSPFCSCSLPHSGRPERGRLERDRRGHAGVIGADRIVDGDELYGDGFSDDVERGDTYGPVTYLLYVPFEQALRWSGRWDDLPAAHGAAIVFDLLVIGGLFLLGRRLRSGREGSRSASRWPTRGRRIPTRPSYWRRTRTTR